MAMFAGAHVSLGGRPFSAVDEVLFSVPEHSPYEIAAGVFRLEFEARLDARFWQTLARMQLDAARRALIAAGVPCRAVWIGDDLSWRVGRSGDVVTMLDDLGMRPVLS